jgi:hypothetical protein
MKGSQQMHFGVSMFHTDYSIPAVQLARALEERGFESMWAPEHSHSSTKNAEKARDPEMHRRGMEGIILFRINPEIISVLDYRKGFGHTDLLRG